MGVEKEPSLGPICTSNVSASETHSVKGLSVIFMRQVTLHRINTATKFRTLKPAGLGFPDFGPVLFEQTLLSCLLTFS